jgi:hypothetical protein
MMTSLKQYFLPLLLAILFAGCSGGKEVVMPFKNYSYSSSRVFPIQKNNTEFSFRVWMSISTSVDRILSVSRDSLWSDEASIVEVGFLARGKKTSRHYVERRITPRSGFDRFVRTVDSLDLLSLKDQQEPVPIALHQPVALYVVEIKKGDSYNCFRFNTSFPPDTTTESEYKILEDFILAEFDIFR